MYNEKTMVLQEKRTVKKNKFFHVMKNKQELYIHETFLY